MTRLPAISLWQPWASLIAVGAKPYETRDWAPPARLIGSRIAIHAARKPVHLACRHVIIADLFAMERALRPVRLDEVPLGVVVATAVLAGAYQCAHAVAVPEAYAVVGRGVPGSPARDLVPIDAFGDYAPGRWAWLLTDVVRLDPPVPARGAQGFFRVEVPDA